jgi:cytochrome c oxidase assembly factor CtaG
LTELLGAWSFEPVVVAGLALTAWAYSRGVRELWRRAGGGRGIGHGRVGCFVAALLVLVGALVSPLDALAEQLFSAHMLQHVLLILVAAPLLAFSDLPLALLWALPAGTRQRVGGWWRRAGALRSMARRMAHPISALALGSIALWGWHVPAAYDAALRNELVHALEHTSFLSTGVLFWESVGLGRRRPRSGHGLGALAVFIAGIQSGLLGALLTLSGVPWYASHLRSAAAWDLSPLEDQQLAGAIMWAPAGVLYLVAFAWLFVRWLAVPDELPANPHDLVRERPPEVSARPRTRR